MTNSEWQLIYDRLVGVSKPLTEKDKYEHYSQGYEYKYQGVLC